MKVIIQLKQNEMFGNYVFSENIELFETTANLLSFINKEISEIEYKYPELEYRIIIE